MECFTWQLYDMYYITLNDFKTKIKLQLEPETQM